MFFILVPSKVALSYYVAANYIYIKLFEKIQQITASYYISKAKKCQFSYN